jgi:putative transposase
MRKPYPSDLTDAQWQGIKPLIPVRRVGRPRTVDLREVLNALFFLDRAGCPWDLLPHDLPPKSPVPDSFAQWREDGTWQEIRDALRREVRTAVGKESAPGAGSIESQTVQATEVAEARGDDGGKKSTGWTRHIIVDTLGLLLVVMVTVAATDEGTIAPAVLARLTAEPCSRWELLWADAKDPHHHLNAWMKETKTRSRIEVVSRPPGSKGFVKWPRRWVVERTFAWRGRYRRNSRDDERYADSSAAMIRIGSIHRMLRLLNPDLSKAPVPFKYRKLQGIVTGYSDFAYQTYTKLSITS